MIRYAIAAALVVAALVMWSRSGEQKPEPSPEPAPVGLDLRGKFIGPTAADDAASLGALCDELAGVIAWDGGKRLKTGVALDDLRVAAREGRMRGASIGDRQPHVRDAIHAYLDQELGASGGPVDDQQRAKWVAAYRNLSRACRDATK
jgi:hypothetical protein